MSLLLTISNEMIGILQCVKGTKGKKKKGRKEKERGKKEKGISEEKRGKRRKKSKKGEKK